VEWAIVAVDLPYLLFVFDTGYGQDDGEFYKDERLKGV
jgi:hypothetical protein